MPGSNLANLSTARVARGLGNLETGLLNAMGEAVIATDLDGYIIFWNRGAERLYGWTADEVAGRNIIDVTPSPDFRATAIEIFDQLTKGQSWSGEFETRHKDGRRLLVYVTDYPVRDEHGKLTAVVGISKLADKTPKPPPETARDQAARSFGGALANLHAAFRWFTSEPRRPGLWRGFAIAALLFGLALVARVLLDHLVPERLPFITFFPAILVAAFVCGSLPTFVLLVASGVTGAIWGSPSDGDLFTFQAVAATLFVVVGTLIIAPVIYALDIHRRLLKREQQLGLINRELKHRLKNLFAVTSSICLQTLKGDKPREEIAASIAGRIQAVATAQDLLGAIAEKGSDLRALAEAVIKPMSPEDWRCEISGPQITLPADATMPFGLILHELATNAVKHGAWASKQGRVVVEWSLMPEGQLEFLWRELNVPLSSKPQREGFGSVLIRRALNQAKIYHEIGPDGARCRIELPL